MKKYEMTLVLTEEIGKDEGKQKKLVEELLSVAGASVKNTNILGARELAYPIKGLSRAWYGIFNIEMPAEKVAELDKAIQIKEEILRYLLIVKE
jgi:ribosomal protein S6